MDTTQRKRSPRRTPTHVVVPGLVISEAAVRGALEQHLSRSRSDWVAPLTTLVALLVAAATVDTEPWRVIYVASSILATVWVAWAVINCIRQQTVAQMIFDDLRSESDRTTVYHMDSPTDIHGA